MKKQLSKLSKAAQEKIELACQHMKPEEIDEPMSQAKTPHSRRYSFAVSIG